jgi:putative ABC transport system substrate-binding protein
MRLIGLAVIFTVSLILAPATVHAQPAGRIAHIGFLSDASVLGPLPPEFFEAFRQGLRELGWVEGRNVIIDFREAKTVDERPVVVAELMRQKPDVIVAEAGGIWLVHPSPPKSRQGWSPVRDVPIVFTGQSDPVGLGLVQSLARPGGTVTGLSAMSLELIGKRLEMLKELLPKLTRVGVLVPSDNPLRDRMVREIEEAARLLSVKLQLLDIASTEAPERIDATFQAMVRGRAEAVLGLLGFYPEQKRKRVCELAARHRLPGAFGNAVYVEAGCLLSYSASIPDLFRRSAGYVDKILKGAKPADLPVEQPTKFELVINLKTAKALGLTIPQTLLQRADQVIE